MTLFTNRDLNRLAVHSTKHQLARAISSAFSQARLGRCHGQNWRAVARIRRLLTPFSFATPPPLEMASLQFEVIGIVLALELRQGSHI